MVKLSIKRLKKVKLSYIGYHHVDIVTESENEATTGMVEDTRNREGKKNKCISLAMSVLSQRMLRMKPLIAE